MNYAESFDQFASRLTSMDLALYAGVGLVLFVLFKDKLSPVQSFILGLVDKFKNKSASTVPVTVPTTKSVVANKEDVFFQLVVSWKQTRDLASQCGCVEAVKVADQMFPYLSPVVCEKESV